MMEDFRGLKLQYSLKGSYDSGGCTCSSRQILRDPLVEEDEKPDLQCNAMLLVNFFCHWFVYEWIKSQCEENERDANQVHKP